MKMFVISDNNDTLMGMRLTGVEGFVVHTPEQASARIKQVISDPETAILLINGSIAQMCPLLIDKIKRESALPLIVEIPDRHGTGRSEDSISEYIRSAIGIKI